MDPKLSAALKMARSLWLNEHRQNRPFHGADVVQEQIDCGVGHRRLHRSHAQEAPPDVAPLVPQKAKKPGVRIPARPGLRQLGSDAVVGVGGRRQPVTRADVPHLM